MRSYQFLIFVAFFVLLFSVFSLFNQNRIDVTYKLISNEIRQGWFGDFYIPCILRASLNSAANDFGVFRKVPGCWVAFPSSKSENPGGMRLITFRFIPGGAGIPGCIFRAQMPVPSVKGGIFDVGGALLPLDPLAHQVSLSVTILYENRRLFSSVQTIPGAIPSGRSSH